MQSRRQPRNLGRRSWAGVVIALLLAFAAPGVTRIAAAQPSDPLGACCLCDGTCIDDVTEADCMTNPLYRRWVDALCSSSLVQCQPLGACCLTDGNCQNEVPESNCLASPFFQSFTVCTPCDEVDCPAHGFCCLCDGTCMDDVLEADCLANPLFVDFETSGSCGDGLCPPATGACCLTNGTCNDDIQEIPCLNAGLFRAFLACVPCSEVECDVGACCLCDGTCVDDVPEADCLANPLHQAYFVSQSCTDVTCDGIGACCTRTGECFEDVTEAACLENPFFQSFTACTPCSEVVCEAIGSCCLCDGTCEEDVLEADCLANPLFQSFNPFNPCGVVPCNTIGACCQTGGACIELPEQNCLASDPFEAFLPCLTCAEAACGSTGACCLEAGTCFITVEDECLAQRGLFLGEGAICPPPAGPRVGSTAKGSLLIFSKVDIRWDAMGFLTQDTFLSITNDYPDEVLVQMYFVNGDPPLAADGGERAHPGWNWIDNRITLTADQPAYWSALTGQPAQGGLSPFTALDPGFPPGRPDGGGGRMLRGFVIAFAVEAGGEEIRWNHLAGNGVIVNYADASAWEYRSWNFAVVDDRVANGAVTGTPGRLNLTGGEYAAPYGQLLVDFQAVGSSAFSGPRLVTSDTSLTLHPASADLRQETDGPVTTKAHIDVWNQNEVKFSGAHRCITCWNQATLSEYDLPNHFLMQNLQTDHGKARIDGLRSQVCDVDADPSDGLPLGDDPHDVASRRAALLGVIVRHLSFDGGADRDDTAVEAVGMGTECAQIRVDAMPPPPESSWGEPDETLLRWIESEAGLPEGALGR